MDRMKITIEQERVDDGSGALRKRYSPFSRSYMRATRELTLLQAIPEKILSIVSPTIAKASS